MIFSEWSFPFNDARMQRKDYTMADLLSIHDENVKLRNNEQMNLFVDEVDEAQPIFMQQYIAHYRRISEDDTRWRETYRYMIATEEEIKDE